MSEADSEDAQVANDDAATPSAWRQVHPADDDDAEDTEIWEPEPEAREPLAAPRLLRAGFLPMIFALIDDRSTGATNAALVDHLKECGSISNPELEAAFRAVDRAVFLPDIDGSSAYDDAPVRIGHFHISQPSLYAQALEMLDLKPGLSFLNVGSGTGYLSSIVAEILGADSLHHGVDIHQDVLAHAKSMFQKHQRHNIRLFNVNAHDLDLDLCPKYDRIYVGACVDEDSKHLLELLAVDGILVGPFETASGQSIRQIIRRTAVKFEVKNLKSVQFGKLVPSPDATAAKVVLPSAAWRPDTHLTHSQGFQSAVMGVLLSTVSKESLIHRFPPELCQNHIFSFLHPRWFDDENEKVLAREDISHLGDEKCEDDDDDDSISSTDNVRLRTLRALASVLSRQHQTDGERTLERFRRLLERHAEEDNAVEDTTTLDEPEEAPPEEEIV